jgi:hypothetical protein
MQIMYMFNNLGIYMDKDMDKHIAQGIEFNHYGEKYHRDNEHKLLEETSSPELGSIVEALSGYDSTRSHYRHSARQISADQAELNRMISAYSTLYKTYTSTMLGKAPTDADRKAMEKALTRQHAALVLASNRMNAGLLNTPNLETNLRANHRKISADLKQLADEQKAITKLDGKYDEATIAGATETTHLRMTSMYYHYLVYFLISLTLIAFTFNILTNPEANTVNAVIVVGAIILIYVIARHYTIYI